MPGMRMSISTTSGAWASAAATASSPVPASATTSIEPVASSTALKPARIIGWSSAMTTRSRLMSRRRRGARRCTSKPRPSRGPAVSVPPNIAARSRMPTSPWPPGLAGAAAPLPLSAIVSSSASGR